MKTLLFLLFVAQTSFSEPMDEKVRALEMQQAGTKTELENFEKQIELVFKMRDKDLDLAAIVVDKRLEQMNEVRGQLKDQAATFLARSEYITAHADLTREVELLKIFQANQEGKLWMLGAGLTAFMTIFQGFGFWLMRKYTHG